MAKIEIRQSDITTLPVDAVVNAANNNLETGGGVAGAIFAAAGPELVTACRKIGWCDSGKAVITPGFRLPARYIIHAVGPVWGAQDEAASDLLLASCYRTSLDLAAAHELKSIAFPAISAGIYGYPKMRAAHIALLEVKRWAEQPGSLERIIMVCFSDQSLELYNRVMAEIGQTNCSTKIAQGED